MKAIEKNEVVLILHNIRSAFNVGSLFRTSDACGVSHVYLCGYTPSPVDRFSREQKAIAKVALGAEKFIPWTYRESIERLVSDLKKKGYDILALEQSKKSIAYDKFKLSKKTALVVGSEVDGIEAYLLEKCHSIIEIPMRGKKESLNVAVATGIALFEIMKIH
jgi:tRNA G18 (ribose-2'-O)-methylase SpoU